MGKFDGKLLFSDLDGTVFDTRTVLPERNIRGIRYFKDNGGRFAVATGRSPLSLKAHREELGVNAPCVVLNGCGVYDYELEHFVFSRFLEKKAVDATILLAQKYPEINTVIFMNDGSMTASRGVRELAPCFDPEVVPGVCASPESIREEDWFKVVFVGRMDTLKKTDADAAAMDIGDTLRVFSGDDMLELLPAGTTKGGGMKELAAILGVPLSDVFAIGDYYNDLEMLDLAGISAAAGQAPEDLRAHATYTACHCDEGAVGWFVEKLDTLF